MPGLERLSLEHHVSALWSQGHLHRVCHGIDSCLEPQCAASASHAARPKKRLSHQWVQRTNAAVVLLLSGFPEGDLLGSLHYSEKNRS